MALGFKYFLLMWLCYRYFEGGVSSVYLWDLDHGFAGVILIKKAGDGSNKIKGCWDSIHVVEVQVIYLVVCCVFNTSLSC
jgi:F-actin capping protein, beta subunit